MEPKELLSTIDASIEHLSQYLTRLNDDPDVYKNGVNAMKALTEARESVIKEINSSNWKKPELLIPVIGVLAEIVLVMNHERLNVIATKVWTRIGR